MQFVNVEFPQYIALGAQSSATWSTDLATTIAGFDSTNENWRDTRHEFDISFAVRNASDFALVRTHFHQTRGRARKFLFKDFLDFRVAQSEGKVLSSAEAAISANGTYYLFKQYGSGSDIYNRKITRPDTPIIVYRTRSGSTTNITGSGAAVTYTTGAVAITGHASGDTYAWSGTFKVPARYDTDRLPAVAINREPGADGELLVSCDSVIVVEVRE